MWSSGIVDNLAGGGPYSSLKFSGTSAWVSYYDASNANLCFATRSSGGSWTPETVASTGTVGLYTNLLLDGASPVILYFKSNTDQLFEAVKVSGTWNYTTLETGGGGLVSAALTPNGHLGYSWFDTAANGLQFLEN